jgi:hypothetical protein
VRSQTARKSGKTGGAHGGSRSAATNHNKMPLSQHFHQYVRIQADLSAWPVKWRSIDRTERWQESAKNLTRCRNPLAVHAAVQ